MKVRQTVLLLLLGACYGMFCTNVSIGTTGFDLTSLSGLGPSQGYSFALCNPVGCLSQGYQYSTRITLTTTGANNESVCTPLTPSTQPALSAYSIVDNGLSIQFPTITSYQPTSTQQISTQLLIKCASTNGFLSASPTTTDSKLTTVITVQGPAGCSFSLPNYLWQFLIDRKLIFALIVLCIGLFELFFGYFLIQITIFLYGWVAGSAFSLIYLAESYPGNQVSPASVINFMIILSALLGIFYGFLLITLPKLGYFNIGVWLGAIGTLMLQNAVLYLSKSLLAFYIVLGVMCLVLGIIAIMAFKYFIIVSTSIMSGFMLVRPLGFYLDYYPNQFLFYKTTASMPWQYYLYLVSMLVLASIGIIFQTWLYKKTGKRRNKLYHLEEEGDFKQKLKKLLEFKEIKKAIASGKEEFNFLKTIVKNEKKTEGQLREEQSHNEDDLQDYNPKNKAKGKQQNSEPQKRRPSDEEESDKDSEEEDVQIEMVDMKTRGPRKPPSKSSQQSIQPTDKRSNNGKKPPVKVVARTKR